MKKHQKLQLIRDSGIIAIMRANNSESLLTAMGVGSNLISQELLDSGDFAEITRRAKAYVVAVKDIR